MPPSATDLLEFSTAAKYRIRWLAQRRPSQVPPDVDWDVWLLLAGRGFGKSRCGSEWVWWRARSRPGTRWAVVAPTFADCRDTCVEGESGILASAADDDIAAWNRSIGELRLANGSLIRLFSAEEPDRLRGPQFHGAWADELAAWEKGTETWDMLQFCLRLGQHPQVVVTTTPKPTKLVRQLVAQDNVVVTRGSTYENRANLAPTTLTSLLRRYEGTRLGRQELMGEILDDVEGALWTRALIPDPIDPPHGHELVRVVVGVDPPGGGRAEAGIVAAGIRASDGQFVILEDRSGRMSPHEWAATACNLYHDWKADRVVAETNYGGTMVRSTIESVDPNVPVKVVTATRGKQQRAEPIVALYEQGRVEHVRGLDVLEDQMVEWVPGKGDSPDRLDGMVWAVTELMGADAPVVAPGHGGQTSGWRG
jgi:phage terminase large subunit-like protein